MGTGTTTDYIVATDDAVEPISGSLFYRTEGRVDYTQQFDTGLSQLVPIRGEAGDVYTISGWMNLWGVPDNAYYKPVHQIECRIKYSNGQSVDIAAAAANPYFIGWQYVNQSFVLKNDQPPVSSSPASRWCCSTTTPPSTALSTTSIWSRTTAIDKPPYKPSGEQPPGCPPLDPFSLTPTPAQSILRRK